MATWIYLKLLHTPHFDFKIRVIYTIILKIYTYVAMPTCQGFNAVAP